MAKTSSVEKNNRRRKLADRYAAKRKALKAIVMDQKKPIEERFRAQLKLAAAAQFGQDPHPQPLRNHRPSARQLPQAQDVPQPTPRTRKPGAYPGHGQGELVRGKHDVHE